MQYALIHGSALTVIFGFCWSCGNPSMISICILALRILHIPLVKSALIFLDCNPNSNLLEADPSIECGSAEHKQLLVPGILSIFFFGFGIIAMFFVILFLNRQEIKDADQDSEIFKKYG